MRIVEIITGGEPGGAQRHVAELVEYLVEQHHDVFVLHGGGKWLGERLQSVAHVVYIDSLKRDLSLTDVVAMRDVVQHLATIHPAVVHAHSSKAGILARAAGLWLHIPVVYTAHGFVFTDPTLSKNTRKLYRAAERWGSRHSRAVITLTEADRAFVRKEAPNTRCELIPNGVTPNLCGERKCFDPPRMGFLGRFTAEKGLPVLIEAARMVPQWQWVIAGDGPLSDLVVRADRDLDQVVWTGWVEEPTEYLSQIDLLVQPSVKEGLPYTVLDAMACGTPVIATPVGAMGDLLRLVDGALLFPAGSPKELLRAARYALEHWDMLSRRVREILGCFYTLDRQLRDTESVLMEAGG